MWLAFALAAGPPFRGLAGTAAVLNAAAPLGIVAVAVALLMIGGEFDLSVGSTVGAASMTIALLSGHFGWALPAALLAALILSVGIGLANGLLVVRTGLPSFIVTLATLFMLRGLTIGGTRALTGRTQIGGLQESPGYAAMHALFASEPVAGFRVSILWWLLAAAAGAWTLSGTRVGNWIQAAGGGPDAARRAGVPVDRVKVGLFVATAVSAFLVAALQAVRFTGADALRGEMLEFRAIVAAVIGGTLLTGGYGSAVGAALGALIFGMVSQGLVMAGADADWFQVFLGGMLLLAVLLNHRLRVRAMAAS